MNDTPDVQQQTSMLSHIAIGNRILQMIQTSFTLEQIEDAQPYVTIMLDTFKQCSCQSEVSSLVVLRLLTILAQNIRFTRIAQPPTIRSCCDRGRTEMHGLAIEATNNLPWFYLLFPQEGQSPS
ncbi:hypothetical protein FRB94_011502 [Tulasnella sp. JGI-2019a]|nr:hypothetical protein FRB94_011502 [Tulasnella sp. JGI-2019a]